MSSGLILLPRTSSGVALDRTTIGHMIHGPRVIMYRSATRPSAVASPSSISISIARSAATQTASGSSG